MSCKTSETLEITHKFLSISAVLNFHSRSAIRKRSDFKRPGDTQMSQDRERKSREYKPMTHILLNFLVLELPTDQPLEGGDRIGRIDHGLSLSRQTH